jgi:hypothetical protein
LRATKPARANAGVEVRARARAARLSTDGARDPNPASDGVDEWREL